MSAHDEDANLYLSVTDNGIGGANAGKGSGLVGLNDRAEALGGKMTITSIPGSGTSFERDDPSQPSAVSVVVYYGSRYQHSLRIYSDMMISSVLGDVLVGPARRPGDSRRSAADGRRDDTPER